jgi:hypothetical protein
MPHPPQPPPHDVPTTIEIAANDTTNLIWRLRARDPLMRWMSLDVAPRVKHGIDDRVRRGANATPDTVLEAA